MLTCIDVKFIFDNVRLGLSSSANILQVADVLRVVFLRLSSGMFLAIISPSSSFSCYPVLKRVKCPPLFFRNQHNQNHQSNEQPKQLNLIPRSSL